jgi:hypothetical protein
MLDALPKFVREDRSLSEKEVGDLKDAAVMWDNFSHSKNGQECAVQFNPAARTTRTALLLSYAAYPSSCGIGSGKKQNLKEFDCLWCTRVTNLLCKNKFDGFKSNRGDFYDDRGQEVSVNDVKPQDDVSVPCKVHVLGAAGRPCRSDYSYVSYCKRTKEIFLAFRGTANVAGWVSNAGGKLPDWLSNLPDVFASKSFLGDSILVHSGFLDGYAHMRPEILKMLDEARTSCGAECTLLVTGHSRGGALAQIAAVDLAKNFQRKFPVIDSITFGQPRVGGIEWANLAESLTCGKGGALRSLVRYFNAKDPVPFVPLLTEAFVHIGTELYAAGERGGRDYYKTCPSNSPACSLAKGMVSTSGLLDAVFKWHLSYLGVSTGECEAPFACLSCDALNAIAHKHKKKHMRDLAGVDVFYDSDKKAKIVRVHPSSCRADIVLAKDQPKMGVEGQELWYEEVKSSFLSLLPFDSLKQFGRDVSCLRLRHFRMALGGESLVGKEARTLVRGKKVKIVSVDENVCELTVQFGNERPETKPAADFRPDSFD